MLYNLFFLDKYDNKKFICTCEEDNIVKNIHAFIRECNKYRKTPFKVYYTRTWKENNQLWFDVGSHSEFFIAEKV